MGGWVDYWYGWITGMGGWVDGWIAKVDNVFSPKEQTRINNSDMYKTDNGYGGYPMVMM